MLEKIDQIQALLNVQNVDADPKNAIANMKILNLLVDLRAETEQLILSGVVSSAKPKEKVKTKKCDYCQKRKNKDTMYFLLKEAQKEYWICQECNYEHDVV